MMMRWNPIKRLARLTRQISTVVSPARAWFSTDMLPVGLVEPKTSQPRRAMLIKGLLGFGAAGTGEFLAAAAPLAEGTASFPDVTAVAISSTKFSSSTTAILTSGYAIAGDGGSGLYIRAQSPTTIPQATLNSLDGAHWAYVPDSRGVNARALGALGAMASAAQNTASIQAAIDYAIYFLRCGIVYLPDGIYETNDVIHLGYGVGGNGFSPYTEITFEGNGPSYGGSSSFGGTNIVPQFADRPCINIQGGRLARVRRMALTGRNGSWVSANGLGVDISPRADDRVETNWLDPRLIRANPNMNAQFAPYAGICVDGYSGAQPSPSYPDVTYPAWLGSVSQYDKAFSSDVHVRDAYIRGFVAGVASSPCNASGNGDFVRIFDTQLQHNVYHFSIGDFEARNCSMENCNTGTCFTVIAANVHGNRKGYLSATMLNCTFDGCIQAFSAQSDIFGFFKLDGCYGESMWRIGDVVGGPGATNPLKFENCQFSLTSQESAMRGVPPTVLDCRNSDSIQVSFDNCVIGGFKGVAVFAGPASCFSFKNSMIEGPQTHSRTFEHLASNFLCGGIMLNPGPLGSKAAEFSVVNNVLHYNIDTGSRLGHSIGPVQQSSRSFPICAWVRHAAPINSVNAAQNVFELWPLKSALQKAAIGASNISLNGRELSIRNVPPKLNPVRDGGAPGDVLYDINSGSVFWVYSWDGTTIKATLQNNYSGVQPKPIVPFSTTDDGTLWIGLSRAYLPSNYTIGTTSTSSPEIVAVGDASGNGSHVTSQFVKHDWLGPLDQTVDNWINPIDAQIVAVTSGTSGLGGRLTLGGKPTVSIRRCLGFITRAPPANV